MSVTDFSIIIHSRAKNAIHFSRP